MHFFSGVCCSFGRMKTADSDMPGFRETLALCALNRIFCYQPGMCLRLLEYFGTAAAVFEASPPLRRRLLADAPPLADAIGPEALSRAAEELERLPGLGAVFIGLDSPAYPRLLRECPDHPAGLYVRSETPAEDLFNRRKAVAFVGTRDLSSYGRTWCGNLVSALSEAVLPEKPLVVSGLAFGIDDVAHETALTLGLPTVGVMATGIDTVYPSRHRGLADRMACSPGSALVTCYPVGTAPLATQFLSRNRIIAGMSEATVLVESKIRGGGMITARYAFEYQRDVYALPGRVDDVRSQGCNLLLRNKTAEPVVSEADLLEKLGMAAPRLSRKAVAVEAVRHYADAGGDPSERELLQELVRLISRQRGISLHEICETTGRPFGEVAGGVGILESDGYVTMDLLQRCSIV